jgi:ureidoglycolate lyase
MKIIIEPMSADAFAPFGDLLEAKGMPDKIINQGLCGRFHDRARMDFSDGRAGISIFHAEKRDLPLKLDLIERHPDGSQAFVPMSHQPFLVVVAEDQNGIPQNIRTFLTEAGQAINIHRGVWHGVLTPLYDPGLFAVIDRIGEGPNLEEYWLPDEVIIATS